MLVVEGEAGVGKSRLLSEALAAFRTPKDAVGIGFGVELTGGEIPYGIGTDLLRTLVRDVGTERVRQAAGAYAPALVPLCPDLGPGGDAEASAARVLPAFSSLVETLASDRLVWLVVEDLPWVDRPSRDLLSYLVRSLQASQVLVLATVRTYDPATDPAVLAMVDEWIGLQGVEGITVSALLPDQTSDLIDDLTGHAASVDQIARIVESGSGNPLITEQLVAAGLDATDMGIVANPIVARIERLDEDTRWLVQLASIGEGHLDHRLLGLAYGASEQAFDRAVEHSLGLRILAYREDTRDFAFTHPLIREAADRTLSPSARVHGHRAWGDVLSEATGRFDDARLVLAAAHHWYEAEAPAQAFGSAVTASKVAQRLGAMPQVATLLSRAWELWNAVENAGQIAGCARDDILIEACEAFQNSDASDRALALISRALTESGTDPSSMRHLCLRICRDVYQEQSTGLSDESVRAMAVAATEDLLQLPPSGPVLQALHELGWILRWKDAAQSLRVHRRALELAHQVDFPAFVGLAAFVVGETLTLCGRFEEATEVSVEARAAVVSMSDIVGLDLVRVDVLRETGQFRASAAAGLLALDYLTEPDVAPADWVHAALRTAASLLALGEWDQAEELQRRCESLRLGDRVVAAFVTARTALLTALRGDVDEGNRLSAALLAGLPTSEDAAFLPRLVRVRYACALTALESGDHVRAREMLLPVLIPRHAACDLELWDLTLLAARIEADLVAARGHRDQVSEEVLSWIQTVSEQFPGSAFLEQPRRLQLAAEIDRAHGVDTAGQWSETRELWRAVEHVPYTAWASLRMAETLGRAGDSASAAEPLREAWETAERLGAKPLRDRAVNLASRARIPLELQTGANGQGPLARLTEREREVLRHVAAGESNAEIAEALYISPKTASVHVSRILTKLGVNSRGKATAVAIRAGMDASAVDQIE